jgi:hypothetical protein
VEKLLTKNMFKNQKAFMYAVYKQQYLELLEKQEYQRVPTTTSSHPPPHMHTNTHTHTHTHHRTH